MITSTDFLVIGSGIAGLSFALKIAEAFPEREIIIATKNDALECNTKYAQGGIAGVINTEDDCFNTHILDTLKAGDYLNDPSIVEMVVKEAPERIYELIQWGVDFDKDNDGNYRLGLEGGHSARRILHHKDITGLEIQRTLLKRIEKTRNIKIHSHYFAKNLIIGDENGSVCNGAYFIDCSTGNEKTIKAKITFLATGGAGQVYQNTTNPVISTGDGIAMAYRAGAHIEDMEFIQFHPTALYNPGDNPSFLISEAVRGMGATLINHKGIRFMDKYSSQGSLAPRDIVARAIDTEMKESKSDYVYLDCTQIPSSKFQEYFPTIYTKCKSIGIDPEKNFIPVVPAAHYFCGGICTDKWGRTTIRNLYAGGECAKTGLHGANRLASNSLLEALVFSHQSFIHIAAFRDQMKLKQEVEIWPLPSESTCLTEKVISLWKNRIKKLMATKLSIVRTDNQLIQALMELNEMESQIKPFNNGNYHFWELKNMLTIAKLIVFQSIERKQNKGLYYNIDLVNAQTPLKNSRPTLT